MSAPFQAVPPTWKDLGKSANDLLNKDYPINGNSLEVKTKTPNNVTFKVTGTRDSKTDKIFGDLEAKWADKKSGTTLTQSWSTANVLRNQVELENHIAKGLKLELISTLIPDKQAKGVQFVSSYKQPGLNTKQQLDLFKGPLVTADAVISRDGFLTGAEATYDVKEGKLSKYNLAAGFHASDYAVTLHALGNLTNYSASYYHRVNPDIETSARATYDTKGPASQVNLEVGTKTYLDNASFLKAKVNTVGILCLGYTQALRPGVKASLGLALDTTKMNSEGGAPAHKVGASMVFES